MTNTIDFSKRQAEADINPMFTDRWSPRAFQKHNVDEATLTRIVEAARWAPSCFNAQPWRIFTSTESTFSDFFDLLVEGNQGWAQDVSVIGFIVAEKNFEHNGKPNGYAKFDCGAAWMSLSLQARMEGLYTHGMGGIHADKAAEYLKIDTDKQEVVMGFTIGKLADLDALDAETREKETPNERKSLGDIWTQV